MKGDNFKEKARSDKVVASGKEKEMSFKDSRAVADTPLKRGAGTAPQSETAKRKLKKSSTFPRDNPAVNAPIDGDGATPSVKSKRVFRLKPDSTAQSSPAPSEIKPKPKLTRRQSNKLNRLERKADKKEGKHFKRESKLPKRHALKLTEKQGDGKRRVKLHFEEQTKAKKETINVLEAPKKAIKQGVDTAVSSATTVLLDGGDHTQSTDERQIRKLTGKAVDTAVGTATGVLTAPARFLNWRTERKYKKFDKAGSKAVKANTKLAYKKYRFESTAQSRPTKKCEARKQSSIKSFAKKAVYERLPQKPKRAKP